MVKPEIGVPFYKKKGLIPLKALIYLLVAAFVVLAFVWIIINLKDKIFG